MRAYFFGNFYLSSIQQGIQAQHCTAEMFMKYDGCTDPRELQLREWAYDHKTSVLLNGGDCDGLMDVRTIMMCDENPYPWAYFKESIGALSEALTCVGIILPEKMYSDETKSYVSSESRRAPMERIMYNYETPNLTGWEFDLITHMNKCGLAR